MAGPIDTTLKTLTLVPTATTTGAGTGTPTVSGTTTSTTGPDTNTNYASFGGSLSAGAYFGFGSDLSNVTQSGYRGDLYGGWKYHFYLSDDNRWVLDINAGVRLSHQHTGGNIEEDLGIKGEVANPSQDPQDCPILPGKDRCETPADSGQIGENKNRKEYHTDFLGAHIKGGADLRFVFSNTGAGSSILAGGYLLGGYVHAFDSVSPVSEAASGALQILQSAFQYGFGFRAGYGYLGQKMDFELVAFYEKIFSDISLTQPGRVTSLPNLRQGARAHSIGVGADVYFHEKRGRPAPRKTPGLERAECEQCKPGDPNYVDMAALETEKAKWLAAIYVDSNDLSKGIKPEILEKLKADFPGRNWPNLKIGIQPTTIYGGAGSVSVGIKPQLVLLVQNPETSADEVVWDKNDLSTTKPLAPVKADQLAEWVEQDNALKPVAAAQDAIEAELQKLPFNFNSNKPFGTKQNPESVIRALEATTTLADFEAQLISNGIFKDQAAAKIARDKLVLELKKIQGNYILDLLATTDTTSTDAHNGLLSVYRGRLIKKWLTLEGATNVGEIQATGEQTAFLSNLDDPNNNSKEYAAQMAALKAKYGFNLKTPKAVIDAKIAEIRTKNRAVLPMWRKQGTAFATATGLNRTTPDSITVIIPGSSATLARANPIDLKAHMTFAAQNVLAMPNADHACVDIEIDTLFVQGDGITPDPLGSSVERVKNPSCNVCPTDVTVGKIEPDDDSVDYAEILRSLNDVATPGQAVPTLPTLKAQFEALDVGNPTRFATNPLKPNDIKNTLKIAEALRKKFIAFYTQAVTFEEQFKARENYVQINGTPDEQKIVAEVRAKIPTSNEELSTQADEHLGRLESFIMYLGGLLTGPVVTPPPPPPPDSFTIAGVTVTRGTDSKDKVVIQYTGLAPEKHITISSQNGKNYPVIVGKSSYEFSYPSVKNGFKFNIFMNDATGKAGKKIGTLEIKVTNNVPQATFTKGTATPPAPPPPSPPVPPVPPAPPVPKAPKPSKPKIKPEGTEEM